MFILVNVCPHEGGAALPADLNSAILPEERIEIATEALSLLITECTNEAEDGSSHQSDETNLKSVSRNEFHMPEESGPRTSDEREMLVSDESEVSTSDDDLGCWECPQRPSENLSVHDTTAENTAEVAYSRVSEEDRHRRDLAYELLRDQRAMETSHQEFATFCTK